MNPCTTCSFMKETLAAFLCLFIFGASFPQLTHSATNRGVQFEEEIPLDGYVLTLNGIGLLKWKYLVNVYLVGLYKPADVPVDKLMQNIPKRLEYYFFVDMEAKDFQTTGYQLMARNIGEEKARSLTNELEALNALYQDVKAGQRYTFTFLPGKGLEMALDGKVLGVVPGDEFGSAYLSIWLGPDPVSKSLQEGMFDPSTRK